MTTITATYEQHDPSKIAIQTASETIRYKEWHEIVSQTAHWIHSIVEEDKTVGIFIPTSIAFLQLFAGTATAGAIAMPLDPKWKLAELKQRIEVASPAVIITTRQLANRLNHLHSKIIIWEEARRNIGECKPAVKIDVEDRAPFYMGFTSGTTGNPKAFVRSHASWVASFACSQTDFYQDATDHVLIPGSLVHSHFLYGAISTLYLGGTLYVMDHFSPKQALDWIKSYPISMLFVVPTMVEAILREKITVQKQITFISSGAKWLNDSKEKIRLQFPSVTMFEFYGASELSFVSFLENISSHTDSQSVGMPFHNVEVEIRADNQKISKPYEVGKIFVRSNMIFSGYINPFTGAIESTQDENGWVTVDDMGYVDDTGCLYVAGREKGMILSGGVNIFPEEIEAVLMKHPGVDEAVVIGLEDTYWGQIPVAVIKGTATERDLKKLCMENLSAYRLPRKWFFIEQIPYTTSGKIARAIVKQLIEGVGVH